MPTEVHMPKMGLIMEAGLVREWLKTTGDAVSKGETILIIETDKVTADVEAPITGVMGPILAEEGARVPVGDVITYVLAEDEDVSLLPDHVQASTRDKEPDTEDGSEDRSAKAKAPRAKSQVLASPAARRLAREHGIDLGQVPGSGPDGSVNEQDVRDHIEAQSATPAPEGVNSEYTPASPLAKRIADERGLDLSSVAGTGPGGRVTKDDVEKALAQRDKEPATPRSPLVETAAGHELIEPTSIQRVAAERLTTSFQTAPHFYLAREIDAARLIEARERLQDSVVEKSGVSLTYTDILVKAVAHTLVEHQVLNAAYADGKIRQFHSVNIGVAVDSPGGLVVPVVREAQRKTLSEIAAERQRVVEKARAGDLALDDLTGGTFTISNLGMLDVDIFQAIINPPQAAILAVGRIAVRPTVFDGELQARPRMWLTLSGDHRVIDGAEAARFMRRLREHLEDPYLLLA